MTKLLNSLEKDTEFQERLIEGAFAKNPNISNFPELIAGVENYCGVGQGQNILALLGDEEGKLLFEAPKTRELIKRNLSEEEYKKMFKATDHEVEGDFTYEVQRQKPVGEKTKKKDLLIVRLQGKGKEIQVKDYPKKARTITIYKKGKVISQFQTQEKMITGYKVIRQKWAKPEINYLRKLKEQQLKPSKALIKYNETFVNKKRTKSSISNKYYKLK